MADKKTAEAVLAADREPTLADANEELGKLVLARWLVEDLGCSTLSGAIEKANARVWAARRRAGYDDED